MTIYYNPQAYGLESVDSLDFSSGCYEFDYLAVWKDAEGNLYWADDSGCSCPSPFESHNRSTLEHGPIERLREHAESRYNGQYSQYVSRTQLEEFLTRVAA